MLRRLFLILICFCLLLGNVWAASDEITNMDGQILVDSNGICKVVVLAEVRFVSRPTTFVFPLGRDARDITASGAVFDTETIDGVVCVVFENASGFSGAQTFQCTYTLPCTMTETGSGQRFTANLPERGWAYPINRFKLTVTFPTEITAFPRWSSAYYGDVIDNYLSIQVADNTVTARSNIAFRDHETLSMELDFGPESFELKHLSEKSVPFDRLAFIFLYILCVGYWLIALGGTRLKRKKDPTLALQSSAGEIPCQLFNEKVDMGALIAHWGNLGYLFLRRSKSGRFRLEKQMDMGNERSAAERRIFGAIFRSTSFIEVPGARFLNACNAEAPVLRAHWKNRMFEKKDGKPGVFLILCTVAGFFFSLMVFDTLFGPNPGRWVWIILLTLLSLPLHRLLQKVAARYYSPSRWLYLGLGGAAGLILFLFASPAECGGYFFFNLLLQVGGGFVTRFGGKRTLPGQEAVEEILSFRHSVRQSDRNSAKQLLRRDSQYFYRMLPYAEILGMGNRFRKHFAPATTEACPWVIDERKSTLSAEEFYKIYMEFLRQLRSENASEIFKNLSALISSILSGVSGKTGSGGRSSRGSTASGRGGSRSSRGNGTSGRGGKRPPHIPRSKGSPSSDRGNDSTASHRKSNTPRRTQHRANPARVGRRSD